MPAATPLGLTGERMPAMGVIAFDPSAGILSHGLRVEIGRVSSTHNRLPLFDPEKCDEIVS
jgi:hypothetical protein